MFLVFFQFLASSESIRWFVPKCFKKLDQIFKTILLDVKIVGVKEKKHVNRLCSPCHHPQIAILQLMLIFSVFFAFVRNDRDFVRVFLMKNVVIAMFCKQQQFNFFTVVALKCHNEQ